MGGIFRPIIDTVQDVIPKVLREGGDAIGTVAKKTSTTTRTHVDGIRGDVDTVDMPAPKPIEMDIPRPRPGMRVWRIFGEAQDGLGGLQRGSLAGGASWTPVDPRHSSDFRWDAGLPDENPARFVIEGILRRPSHVTETRPALPLDGNPGGWPEYLIDDPLGAIEIRDVSGVNLPFTHGPGDWSPE